MENAQVLTVFDAITDFLGAAPTLEEIAAYRLPDEFQQRAHALLDLNRRGSLSPTEQTELEEFRQADHLLTLIKGKARLKLKGQA
ncbi:MAG: hypothetical protein ACOYL5_15385 [Phototrophicaceae bacterium]|jgi:hypothetical protein